MAEGGVVVASCFNVFLCAQVCVTRLCVVSAPSAVTSSCCCLCVGVGLHSLNISLFSIRVREKFVGFVG
uniref:Putative secreted peptide n=1 Tax=Anopheles braziliensis TaxID=58242 RepID=A0A2M3ZWN0_9DIPT